MAAKEQLDSQRMTISTDSGIEVERIYTLLWADRFTEALPQVGDLFDGDLPTGITAANANLVCVSTSVERYGAINAKWTALYRTYHVPSSEPIRAGANGVTLSLSNREMLWHKAGADDVLYDLRRVIPTATITVRLRATDTITRRMASMLGCVNNAVFLDFKPLSVLFCGAEESRTGGISTGLLTGNIWLSALTFQYNGATYGWNTAYSDEGEELQWTGDGSYPQADLNALF